jgi:Ca2+-binding EF-hand superfamily protein
MVVGSSSDVKHQAPPVAPAVLDKLSTAARTRTRAILKHASVRECMGGGPKGPKLMREIAHAFLTADKNHDHRLDYEEFLSAVPAAMKAQRSDDVLRQLFRLVDADETESISLDEFFVWTLSFLKSSKGSGLDEVFRKYDRAREPIGNLNALEFAAAAEDVGFGEVANELFLEFDVNQSGCVLVWPPDDVASDDVPC